MSFPIGSGAVTMCKAQYHVYHGICLRLSVDSTTSSNSLRLVDSTRVSIRILLQKAFQRHSSAPFLQVSRIHTLPTTKTALCNRKHRSRWKGGRLRKRKLLPRRDFSTHPCPYNQESKRGQFHQNRGLGLDTAPGSDESNRVTDFSLFGQK